MTHLFDWIRSMFETYSGAEIEIPIQLKDGDTKYWDHVELSLFTPWFLVVYRVSVDDTIYSRTILASRIDAIVQIKEDSECELLEVALVSPGHLNRVNRWKLEALKEIKICQEPDLDHEQEAIVYVLKNGKQYVDSALDTSAHKLKHVTTKYRF